MSTEDNKALVRRLYEEQNGHNLDYLDEALVPDYVHHDPALPPEMQHGRDNYRQLSGMFYTAFPDLQGTLEDMVAEGDKVVTRLRWQGTHQAELMGIPPSGKQVDFTMMSIHRIVEGKITEGWVNFDMMGMMQQLGAVPNPGRSEG
jgi:steroid delta-isomerase-like uncharacterized protein